MNRLDGAIRQLHEEFARSVACHGMWDGYTIQDIKDAVGGEWAEVVQAIRRNDLFGEHGLSTELLQLACVSLKGMILLESQRKGDGASVSAPSRDIRHDPETGIYENFGRIIGALTDTKQAAYGNSFGESGKILRILYPQGIKPEQMDDALCIVRMLDKCFRIATDRDALGESPYRDIAGYALLGALRAELRS